MSIEGSGNGSPWWLRLLPAVLRRRMGSDLDRSFATGSASALVLKVGGTGLLLLLQILLTRTLGPERYGDYVYALAWISVLAVAAACGMDTAALRFVAAYRGTGEWALLRGFLRWSAHVVLAASLGLAAAVSGCVLLLGDRISDGLRSTFFAASLLLPLVALLLLLASLLRGFQQVASAMVPQFVLRPLLLGLVVAALYFVFGHDPAAADVMLADCAVSLALVSAMFYLIRRRSPAAIAGVERRHETRQWLAAGLPMLVTTAVRMAMSKVDVLMIGLLLNTTAAGVYAVGAQLAGLINFGLFAVNVMAAPLISELHARKRRQELQRIVGTAALGTFAFSTLTGLFLLLLGKPVLRLFGPAFVSAYAPLSVLILGQIFNSLAGSVGFLMNMTAHERAAARVTVLTGTLQLILAFLLIPRFGTIGAAWATVTAGVAWNGILVLMVHRRLRIDSTAFSVISR